jgi:type II secretion system protein H
MQYALMMMKTGWSTTEAAMDAKTKRRGFTLVELMIVIAVIGVLATMSAPSLFHNMADYKLNGTVRAIFATLQYARMCAASAGKEYRVRFFLDNTPQGYRLEQGNHFSGSDSWATRRDYHPLPEQVRINHATDYRGTHQSGTSVIAFNPQGTASSGGVYLKNSKGKIRSVKVSSSTGRIRMENNW